MRIILNERCQGHARCLEFAPDVFDIDDEGFAYIREGREVVTDIDADLAMAMDNCPEQAIEVIDA